MIAISHDMALEEQVLAERIGAGDQQAFRVLFERYRASIYRYCLLMLGDRDRAEDIYQDAFMNFYRACREGKTMYSVRGYLVTVARTRCLSAIKKAKRTAALEDVPEPSFSPKVGSADINDHLRQALLEIPEQYREAFLLFELEGYSYEEIAEYLDVSHNVVKNRIYRAKQSLQKILGPLLRDDNSGELML